MKIKNISYYLVFTILLLSYSSRSFATEQVLSNTQAIKRVSSLLEKLPIGKQPLKLAILPFSYLDGTYSSEGAIFADLLLTKLINKSRFQFIERENIDKILDEILISNNSLPYSKIVKNNRLFGVQYFIFGSIVDLGERLKISIRVAQANSGKIVKHDSFFINRQIKDMDNPIWETISKIKNSGEPFKIKLWTNTKKVQVGDNIKIFFQAEKNCYVTLFSLGSSGKLSLLFPNLIQNNNYVKAGKIYSIPSIISNFMIKATPPTGVNCLKIFAVTENIPLKLGSNKSALFRGIKANEIDRLRDFAITLKNIKNSRWAEAEWDIIIEAKK